jgi:hypothetical protein
MWKISPCIYAHKESSQGSPWNQHQVQKFAFRLLACTKRTLDRVNLRQFGGSAMHKHTVNDVLVYCTRVIWCSVAPVLIQASWPHERKKLTIISHVFRRKRKKRNKIESADTAGQDGHNMSGLLIYVSNIELSNSRWIKRQWIEIDMNENRFSY